MDLHDDDLDIIRFEPEFSRVERLSRPTGGAAQELSFFLGRENWSDLRQFADAVAQSAGTESNDLGFTYATDEPYEPPDTGVLIYSPWDEVAVSAEAFDRLMARWLMCVRQVAEESGDPAVQAPWWPEFTGHVEAIVQRAGM